MRNFRIGCREVADALGGQVNNKSCLALFLLLGLILGLMLGSGATCTRKADPIILEKDCISRVIDWDYALVLRYVVRNDGEDGMVKVIGEIRDGGYYRKDVTIYLYKGQTYSGELVFTKPTIWGSYTWTLTAHAD